MWKTSLDEECCSGWRIDGQETCAGCPSDVQFGQLPWPTHVSRTSRCLEALAKCSPDVLFITIGASSDTCRQQSCRRLGVRDAIWIPCVLASDTRDTCAVGHFEVKSNLDRMKALEASPVPVRLAVHHRRAALSAADPSGSRHGDGEDVRRPEDGMFFWITGGCPTPGHHLPLKYVSISGTISETCWN